jgi:hypothetical protein
MIYPHKIKSTFFENKKSSVFYFVPHPSHKSFYTTHFLIQPNKQHFGEKAKKLFCHYTKISCEKASKAK